VVIRKFFLHISKEEQKKRFLERLEDPKKNWKFSMADVNERGFWKDYQEAYEEMDPEYSDEGRAVVRGSCGQQVVYAADRGFRDYPGARRTPSFLPRGRQSQEERAGSRAPFPARPERISRHPPAICEAQFALRFKINFERINQRHQPLEQLLMNRMRSVSVQRGPVGELHHAAKLISLRAGRHVDTNPGLQQAWNLPLQSTNFASARSF